MAQDISAKLNIQGYQKYYNSMDKVKAQARTLASEMRLVESAFSSESTAQEKAAAKADVLTRQISNQENRVALLAEKYQESAKSKELDSVEMMKLERELNDANAVLNKMRDELDKNEKVAGTYGAEIQNVKEAQDKMTAATKKMEALERISEFFDKASQAASQFAHSAIDAAKELDQGYDTIVKKTGATGEKLEELSAIANDIYGSMPESMENIGSAIGEVQTRLGLTGDDLQATSVEFLKFAKINETDVSNSVDSVQKALAAFGLDASDTSRILAVMTAAGQDSGVSMDELASAMVKNAGALNELGLSAEQSIMFIGRLEKSGVDSETALSGMSRALKNATKQGIPLNQALEDLENTILNGTDDMDGLSAAYDLFGKSGDKIYNAVKKGSISFKDLSGSVEDYGDIVERTYEATLSPWDKTQVAMQNVKRAGGELAKSALSVWQPAIERFSKVVEKGSKWIEKWPSAAKAALGGFLGLATATTIAAPKVLSVAKAIQGLQIARQTAHMVDLLSKAEGENVVITKQLTVAQKALQLASTPVGVLGLTAALAIGATVAYDFIRKIQASKGPLGEYGESLRGITEEAHAANEALSAANESLGNSMSGYKSAMADTEASAALARDLADELVELSNNTNRTTEEQARMESVLSELKAIYPGFTGEINKATGELNIGEEQIYAYIDSLEEMARAKAYEEQYSELMKELVASETAAYRAEKERERIVDQMNDTTTEGGRIHARYAEEIKKCKEAGMDAEQQYKHMRSVTVELNGKTMDLEKAMQLVSVAEGGASEEAADLAKELMISEQQSAETEETLGYLREQLGMIDSSGAVSEMGNLGNASETTAEAVGSSMDEMSEAYDEQYQAALNSLKPTTALFDEMAESTKEDLGVMRQNMEEHLTALANWDSNMQYLMNDARFGTDEAFTAMVQMLAEAGPESAGYLEAIVQGAQEGSDDFNAILAGFSNKETLDANVADTMATALATTTAGTDAMTEAVDTGMTETDAHMAQNAAMMQRNIGTYGNQWSTASKASGGRIPRGVKIGVDAKTGLATNAASTMAALVKSTARAGLAAAAAEGQTQGGNLSSGTASGISSKASLAADAALQMANSAKKQLDGLESAGNTAGKNFGQGLISGMSAKVGQIAEKARQLADTANQAYNNRLEIKSPSRVMMRSGRFTAEGIALGMEQGLPMVERASEKLALASEAIVIDPDIISGRSSLSATIQHSIGGLNANVIYDAIVAGMNGVKFQIDRREFQRILHDVGVATA